jgi:2'-5' RNA ligase
LVGSRLATVRLFVGVGVDEAVRREAQPVEAHLRRRLGSQVNARWVPPDNLHITVRFIGHVPDDRAAAMVEALAAPLTVPAFDIEFSGCGRFPPRGGPRVLWIGVSRGLDSLTALHEEFNRRVARFGYELEARAYSAHLTLARLKDAAAGVGRVADEAMASISIPPIVQQVDRVTIFESRLSPNGPRYTSVRDVPLPRAR